MDIEPITRKEMFLQKIAENGGGSGGGVQPDLSQNDPTAADYVKNRTHWAEISENILTEQTVSNDNNTFTTSVDIIIGETYIVEFDGVKYELVGFDDDGYNTIGAPYNDWSEYPFQLYNSNGELFFYGMDSNEHAIKVIKVFESVHKLDEKYLPDTIARKSELFAVKATDGIVTLEDGNGVVLSFVGEVPKQFKIWDSDVNTVIFPNAESVGESAFQGCEALIIADFPNVQSVERYAFSTCGSLHTVNLPKATSIKNTAFMNCSALTSLNISNVINLEMEALYGCSALTSVALPNATSIGNSAFNGCTNLATVDLSSAKTLGDYVFSDCQSLKELDCPSLESLGSSMGFCFRRSGIEKVNFPMLKTMAPSAFSNAVNLKNIDLPLVETITSSSFTATTSLETAKFAIATKLESSAFNGATALKQIDIPCVTMIQARAFHNCNSLVAIILRSETMCTLGGTNALGNCYHFYGTVNATYNPDGLKDGYIYVPRALIDSYKAESNWSTFATQFRALEDYTVDGTITGELDETKVTATEVTE